MLLKLLKEDLSNFVSILRLTMTYLSQVGFILARRFLSFFVIGVWLRFYAGGNPIIWTRFLECFCSSLFVEDLLHVIPREDFINLISAQADLLYAQRLNRIKSAFEVAFKLWDSKDYLAINPDDLAEIIKKGRYALFSLSPLLNFSDWLKLWAVTLQPLTPLSTVYSVYTKTKFLSRDYGTFIRQGLLGCSLIKDGHSLPPSLVTDSYAAFVWVLASARDSADLDLNVPDFRKILKAVN